MLIVLADAFIYYGHLFENRHIRRIFAITKESTVVNWWSSLLFFFLSIVLFLLAIRRKREGQRWRFWDYSILSAWFMYLSIDDSARMHERLGSAFKDYALYDQNWNFDFKFSRWLVEVFPSYYWQVVYAPLLFVMGLSLLIILWTELKTLQKRSWLIFSLVILVLSQFMDFIEGYDEYEFLLDYLDYSHYTVEHFAKSFEEFMEMLGINILIILLLKHFLDGLETVKIDIKSPS